jgi:YD repeat-containing protein
MTSTYSYDGLGRLHEVFENAVKVRNYKYGRGSPGGRL